MIVTVQIYRQPNKQFDLSGESDLGHVDYNIKTGVISVIKRSKGGDLIRVDIAGEGGLEGATLVLKNRSGWIVAIGVLGEDNNGNTILIRYNIRCDSEIM